jgi:predicted XRE-type DNA-binding protein
MSKNGKKKMDKKKKEALESKGYKVSSVEEFLELSTEESEYIELKLALSDALAKRRKKSNLTQAQLAKMLKSSQSRVAKMEKGDPTVSVDLLVKSLLAMGDMRLRGQECTKTRLNSHKLTLNLITYCYH